VFSAAEEIQFRGILPPVAVEAGVLVKELAVGVLKAEGKVDEGGGIGFGC
jgi:hypothetical protein